MRSLIRDIFLSLILLSIFAWAGYTFYKDLNNEISNEGGEVIGEITFIENGAQRKFSGRAVWGELETSAPLYNYDSLRTIEDARAVVKLIDGTEITLEANTYIVLEWGEEARNIEFLGGNISAASGGDSDLQIKSEDTVIALNKASVTLDKREGEEINLSVDEGTIGVTRDGETTNIEENFRASISDDIMVEQDAVKLKYPANNRLIVTTSAAVPLDFSWESILPLNNPRLEIGEYRDFLRFTAYELGRNSVSYRIDSLPGTYYWRISGEFADGSTYNSPSNRVVIIRDNAPGLQVPLVDETFEYRNTPPDLAFSWEASSLANGSRLQVASDSGFTNLVINSSGPNNFSTITDLEEGNYFWRVIPEYTAADLIAYSSPEVRRFFVQKNDSQEPPRLILPAAEELVNPLKRKEGLRFSWKADREIGSYHILVAKDREMNEPVADQWLSRNSFLLEEIPP
ncbi:MAG: FecR family protein, partial [Spirochaetales bacterium]|nr:FecR family protein [Spirochaetales bacterium]